LNPYFLFAAFGGMLILSFRPGRAKEQKNHGNPVYPVYYITEGKLDFSSCEP
jgi:hypothetical protein